MLLNGAERRARLADARLLLVLTPDMAADDPLPRLADAWEHVDIVQVRPKARGDRRAAAPARSTVTEARACYDLCERLLDELAGVPRHARPLVMVNDRVDVAAALADRGVDGVHVGADDAPAGVARETLGDDLLLGLSTHSASDVAAAWDEPVDLLGFGPVFATSTKGYGDADAARDAPRVGGPESAWIASETAPVPLFPIGGIDLSNADQLARVGRAAVGSAIVGAAVPGDAARALRGLLFEGDG